MRKVTKILDSTSGDSLEFVLQQNILLGRLSISGSPAANIKVFIIEEESGAKMLKISCPSWNGASAILKAKTSNIDDSFTETGIIYSENLLEQIEIFQSI